MNVEVRGNVIRYHCFRAGCDTTLSSGAITSKGMALPSSAKPRPPAKAKDYFLQGYTRQPIYDNNGEVRGWVHRADTKGVVPKTINDIDEDWCKLHIPSRLKSKCVLLVEDRASAEKMNPYFPTVALLGVRLTYDKIKYLTSQGVECAIIALDNDATSTAVKLYRDNSFIVGIQVLSRDLKDERTVTLLQIATDLEATYGKYL